MLNEAITRVVLMASGDPKWDLSPNDIAALKRVLLEIWPEHTESQLDEAYANGRDWSRVNERNRIADALVKEATALCSIPDSRCQACGGELGRFAERLRKGEV